MRNRQSGTKIEKKKFIEKVYSYISFWGLFKSLHRNIWIVLLVKVILTLLQIIGTIVTKRIIDLAAYVSVNLLHIIELVVLNVVINVIAQIVDLKNDIRSIKLNYSLTSVINWTIIEKLKRIRLENLENPETYDLLKRIDENLTESSLNMINGGLQILVLPFTIIMYSLVLGQIRCYFPIIVICASIPYFFIISKKGMDEYYLCVQQSANNRKLTYLYNLLTARNAIKEIKIYNLTDYLIRKIKKIRSELWKEKYSLLLKHTVWLVFISILKYISLGICLLITCKDVYKNQCGIGNIILAITATKSILESMLGLLGTIGEMNANLYNIADLETYLALSEVQECIQQKINNMNIEFKNVFFKYPANNNYTLCNINTHIREGEKIALVGDNGSGKTTFINLLLGLYDSNQGNISIDGKKLEDIVVDLRKKTACVFQDFIQYQFSIRENILLDTDEDSISLKGIGGLENAFYLSFKEEENTLIGQFDDNGTELSGGQWQRIAIYRALLRKDIELLILDEPTAKLDPCIESKIYEEFYNLTNGKTVILISHRLSATKLCDRILVFEKGKIVEEGNHETLLNRKGRYYEMFMTQKKLYI